MPLTCPSCNTPVLEAPGIGPFCPNTKCWRIDDLRPDSEPLSMQERVAAARAVVTEQTKLEADAKRYQHIKANCLYAFPVAWRHDLDGNIDAAMAKGDL